MSLGGRWFRVKDEVACTVGDFVGIDEFGASFMFVDLRTEIVV